MIFDKIFNFLVFFHSEKNLKMKNILKKVEEKFSEVVVKKTVHWHKDVKDNEGKGPMQKRKSRLSFIEINLPVKPVKSLQPPKIQPRLFERQLKQSKQKPIDPEMEAWRKASAAARSKPRPQSRK